MGQETRKDPRAKVLTMTVRYKSATLDEFIEHHSHDVSRGGMFIKTPSPFPPGTLLKFEVKIAEDQKVIQGVGRVVWKRESETGDKERPNGMGVKFIKIDDVSRKTIDTLVEGRGNASAAYEAGGLLDPSGTAGVRRQGRWHVSAVGLGSGHARARRSHRHEASRGAASRCAARSRRIDGRRGHQDRREEAGFIQVRARA
jgi:uncharacterized protein (TIGR02266 family)